MDHRVSGPARPAPPRHARRARLIAPLLAALALAGIATACSSSSSPSSTGHVSSSTNSGGGTSAPSGSGGGPLAFSACMRSHGVHNFPDPTTGANGQSQVQIQPGSNIDSNSPAYQAALQACQSLNPVGVKSGHSLSRSQQAQYLRYAACMRSHGEPRFPDPTFNGNSVSFGTNGAIDPNSPQYQSAAQACASVNPSMGSGG
jgi:hypothetical protein